MKNLTKRLKNYGLWIAVASLSFMLAKDLGLQVTPEKWDAYVNGILGVLVLLGIVNNPLTNKKGFGDDE